MTTSTGPNSSPTTTFSQVGSFNPDRSNGTMIIGSLCRSNRRGLSELQLLDRHLAQPELLDLAADRHRKRIDELPVAWNLEVGDLSPTVLAELFDGRVFALLQDDPGHDLLSIFLVGDAYHLYVLHLRMRIQELLYLAGVHVLSPANDHVLGPGDDIEVAVCVHCRQVAGMHPAASGNSRTRGLRVVPVAKHHVIPAHQQLAARTTRDNSSGARVN